MVDLADELIAAAAVRYALAPAARSRQTGMLYQSAWMSFCR